MKRVLLWLLSLGVAFGLAVGQSDQDTTDPAGNQDAPAVEQPMTPDDPADDGMGQDDTATDDTEGDPDGTADDMGQPADDMGDPADGMDDPADDPAAADDPAGAGEDTTTEPDQTDDAGQDMGAPAQEDTDAPADDMTDPASDPATDPAGADQADTEDDAGTGDTFVEALRANPDFSIFADALERSNLAETLAGGGQFTILAPTNQAWMASGFDAQTLDQQQLTDLVRNHIISGVVSADQLSNLAGVVTLLGNEYTISPAGGDVVAEGPADGEVAGGGQAEPAEPIEPTEPGAADGDDAAVDDPVMDGQTDTPAQPGEEAEAADMPAEGLGVGEGMLTADRFEVEGGVVYGIDSVLVPASFDAGQEVEEATPVTPVEPATPADPAEDDAGADPADDGAAPADDAAEGADTETDTDTDVTTPVTPVEPDPADPADPADGVDGEGAEGQPGDTTDFGADEPADEGAADDATDTDGAADDTTDTNDGAQDGGDTTDDTNEGGEDTDTEGDAL